MGKGYLSLKEKNIIEKISASWKEQQSDSRDARPVEINDCARAGAELLAIEVQGGIEVKQPMELRKNAESMIVNRGFRWKFGRKSSKCTTF